MEQRQYFQQMVLEQLDIHRQKKKKEKNTLDTNLMLFMKNNSKWIIDPNVKLQTIKLLVDNIGDNLGYGILGMVMTF